MQQTIHVAKTIDIDITNHQNHSLQLNTVLAATCCVKYFLAAGTWRVVKIEGKMIAAMYRVIIFLG